MFDLVFKAILDLALVKYISVGVGITVETDYFDHLHHRLNQIHPFPTISVNSFYNAFVFESFCTTSFNVFGHLLSI